MFAGKKVNKEESLKQEKLSQFCCAVILFQLILTFVHNSNT